MNEYSEIKDFFSQMGGSIGASLREDWKERLLNDSVQYKRSILLSLRRQYYNLDEAHKDGFTKEMLQHAVYVLRKNGYAVDMMNGIIEKDNKKAVRY